MPKIVRRKVYRRKRVPKLRRKRYGKRRMTTKVIRSQFTTDRVFCKLDYFDHYIFGSFIQGQYVYRGNSVYDPYYSGLGSQPLGFDNWAGMYENYRVHSSRILTRVSNMGSIPMSVCLFPSISNSGAPTYIASASSPFAKTTIVGAIDGSSVKMLKHYMKTIKMHGERIFNNDNYAAGVTGNPTSEWYWIVTFFSQDASTNLNFAIDIKVTYYVEFFKRKQLDLS